MAKEGRVFLRGMSSQQYGLKAFRQAQLPAPRVRGDEHVVDDARVGHSGGSKDSRTWWRIGPGDDPFLTQNVQIHFVEIPAGKSNHGHGHQNEAVFYILQGSGYEIHDDPPLRLGARRPGRRAQRLGAPALQRRRRDGQGARHEGQVDVDVPRAHPTGPQRSGRGRGPLRAARGVGPHVDARRGPAQEGRQAVGHRVGDHPRRARARAVLDRPARRARLQHRRLRAGDPPGSRSAKHWHMADEVLYVLSGSGHSLHWEVEAEIAERYYARVAKEPTRHAFGPGDTIYVPQNHVHQHFNDSDDEPLRLISAQNRLIKHLGYDQAMYLEDAPEFAARSGEAVGAGGAR